MFNIAKEFYFDASHMLDAHAGKCRNLHGHTYRLHVEIEGELITHGSSRGMVMDFDKLKHIVQTRLIEHLDHAFLYDKNSDNESQLANLLITMNRKVFAFPCQTTAELMSEYLFTQLSLYLPITTITLWETPTAYCKYKKG